MDTIMAWFGITLALLVVCWICYSHLTSSIIKDQEREISGLEKEISRLKVNNARLEQALKGSRMIKSIEVYTEPQKPNLRIVRHADRHSTTSGNDELFGEW